jgi:hypothetical protein
MMILRRHSPSCSWTGLDSRELGVGYIKTDITIGQGKASPNITSNMSPWRACCCRPRPTRTCSSAMMTHYEPRIKNFLISANVTSTQEAFAFLTKLQSLESSREQYRAARRLFDREEQTRTTPREQPHDNLGNRRPNGSVQARHVRRDGRDRDSRGFSMRNPSISAGLRNFYGGQGRPNDGTDPQLNTAAQDFVRTTR